MAVSADGVARLVLTATGSELAEPNHFFAVAAVVALAAWPFAYALVAAARRVPHLQRAPATMDLPDDPPAIGNMLCHSWSVTREAVSATFVDLAARDHISIDRVGDETLCSIPRRPPRRGDALLPYEERVLGVLTSRAADGGAVPAGALTTGNVGVAGAWFSSFQDEVIADAQRRGYAKKRWDAAVTGPLGTLAVAALGLFIASLTLATGPESDTFTVWKGTVLGGFFLSMYFIGVVGKRASSPEQRPTPEGLRAAHRWLGTRQQLIEDTSFDTLAPDAVAIWDRYLACAAAVGAAGRVAETLPLAAADDHRAWSNFKGRWRPVRVHYPRLPPGRGRHPVLALLGALFFGGIAFKVLAAMLPIHADGAVRMVESVIVAFAAAVLAWQAVMLVQAVPDLFTTIRREGQVIRTRTWPRASFNPLRQDKERHYVAVDDGATPSIRAWVVRKELHDHTHEGQQVVATVTPLLRYVRSIETS